MGVWNINYTTDLISAMAQSGYTIDQNVVNNFVSSGRIVGTSSEYARILAKQINKINSDLQSAINQQKQKFAQSQMPAEIEIVKRFKADGSILIMTYEDGTLKSTTKKKPHLVPVPDLDAPPKPSGEPAMKLEPRFSVIELLLMM